MALPALIPLLKFLSPYAASLLFSRIGAGAAHGQQKELERLFSPESIGAETDTFFDIFKNSPMYQGLRSQAMTGAQQLGNRLESSFQRRGLGTSGIAGVKVPLAQSSFQKDFLNIDAAGFNQARQDALANLMRKAGFQQPSIGAGTWGGFFGDLAPQMTDLFKSTGGWDNFMDIFKGGVDRSKPGWAQNKPIGRR